MTDPAGRQLLLAAAGLLDMGRSLERLSCPLVVLAFGGLLAPLVIPVPLASWFALLASVLAGSHGAYMGARVAFDASLFRALAADGDTAALDGALLQLGLMPAAKAGRPLAERVHGAKRLLLRQALSFAVQAGALLAAGCIGLSSA